MNTILKIVLIVGWPVWAMIYVLYMIFVYDPKE